MTQAQSYPLRISYSSRSLLHLCERKFQLYKLVEGSEEAEAASHFCHGHAFGAGVAAYLLHGDRNRALLAALLAYWPVVEDQNHNRWKSLAVVEAAFPHLDSIRSQWEVATFDGKPAIELSCRLNISPTLYDVSYMDVVLKHKTENKYAVFECKTTSSRLNDISPLYRNSSQTIGYSIILDKIANQKIATFGTFHFVSQIKNNDYGTLQFHTLYYPRTVVDRLQWFYTLGLDVEKLEKMRSLNYFPMRGESCLAYNRVCQHFGTCQLRASDKPKILAPDKRDEEGYQFEFFLDEVLQDTIQRAKEIMR